MTSSSMNVESTSNTSSLISHDSILSRVSAVMTRAAALAAPPGPPVWAGTGAGSVHVQAAVAAPIVIAREECERRVLRVVVVLRTDPPAQSRQVREGL